MKLSNDYCIVDVGANHGDFCIPVAEQNPNVAVLAFEPNPVLFQELQLKVKNLHLSNLKIFPDAVSTRVGIRKLNVSSAGDQGVSSLLQFNTENINSDPYWQKRQDLWFEAELSVNTVRLDHAITQAGFHTVRFLKIDAQGLDLDVLESASGLTVEAGMLEVPTIPRKALYQDEPSLKEALIYLESQSFEIWDIKPNDPANSEVNLFFTLIGKNMLEVEEALGLDNINLYCGKDFWSNPSASPDAGDRLIHDLENLAERVQNLENDLIKSHQQISYFKKAARDAERRIGESAREESLENLYRIQFESVINSRTWRFTSPIRWVVGLLRFGGK